MELPEGFEEFVNSDEFKPAFDTLVLEMLSTTPDVLNKYFDKYGLYHVFEDRNLLKSFATEQDAIVFIKTEGRNFNAELGLSIRYCDNQAKNCDGPDYPTFVFDRQTYNNVVNEHLNSICRGCFDDPELVNPSWLTFYDGDEVIKGLSEDEVARVMAEGRFIS